MSAADTQALTRALVGMCNAFNEGLCHVPRSPNPFKQSPGRLPRTEPGRTAAVIYDMMTDSTGHDILDSGGYYGRAWQQNRTNGFERHPEAWLSFDSDGEIYGAGVSLFAYLNEFLTFDAGLQSEFEKFNKKYDPENRKAWLEIMEAFADEKDSNRCGAYNTYNDEWSLLSGIIQYVTVDTEDGECILLQHHGGCDVRGVPHTAKVSLRP